MSEDLFNNSAVAEKKKKERKSSGTTQFTIHIMVPTSKTVGGHVYFP
jgi:hypothetical protein